MLHLVTVVLLVLSVHSGESLKCYVCSSRMDPNCKDPFNKDYNIHQLEDCTHESMQNIREKIPGLYYSAYHGVQPSDFVCMKAVTKRDDGDEVVRSCTIPRADTFDVCAQLKSKDTFCRTCLGDACNSAVVLSRSLIITFLPVCVGVLGFLKQ
ncbi:uncharacterized protein LOC128990211 isoform X1 [Macrosteles quadrilineatus]|uniref:uncharacterized protein LOC128990205 n=1 Tax=Macrosteles quadrilineatus TaxID=74068 RepID=UPI0023E1ABDD|nr:uncharacterized protein LOC128990205 [Macrosteles quadrilineatus]XP_054268476.1 uncharacterized protein LOC128990211 isoform X1 [Macrosteles quadrilineatus]